MARVLVLCEHASLNGGERSLLAVVDRLSEMGFSLQIAAPPEGPLAAAIRGTAAELVPLDWNVEDPQRRPELRRERLRACLRQQKPDLLHANSLAMSRLSGPVAKSLELPSVGHLRDMMRLSRAAAQDINCHRRLIAVSEAVRDWYGGAEIDSRRISVVYNGVDLQRFRPRPATGFLQRERGLPRESRLIVSVGQIILRKGFDVLADAARLVLARHGDVQFLVVGARFSDKSETVAYEAALHRAAAERPLAGHFHFLGVRDDLEDVLAEATLLAHPARQEPLRASAVGSRCGGGSGRRHRGRRHARDFPGRSAGRAVGSGERCPRARRRD